MLFELQLALKYLIPKRRSLSAALVSLLSVAVVSLVVWLVLVFLSVTAGIEKNWLGKLLSLQGAVRIAPTEGYYHSYFYQIDSLASASNFSVKTLGEKAESVLSDPYVASADMEIPPYWPSAERDGGGVLIDPVKRAVQVFQALQREHPSLSFQDFEIGGALLKISLHREARTSTLSQMSYLLSLPEQNPRFGELLLENDPNDPLAAHLKSGKVVLPDIAPEVPILLPKSYKESGVRIGDPGSLSYGAPTASAQEQRIAIRIAGFYDPGFLSLGNRCIVVPQSVTRTLYTTTQTSSPDGTPTNGFFLWPASMSDAPLLKRELQERFAAAKIDKYWKIATFEEYEASKDLLQQFQSDKILFTLVGGLILLLACSNTISFLILLVHDKKREIAVLQAMGASFKSIAALFGAAALVMGLVSAVVGIGLAIATLRHIDGIVSLLSFVQGRSAFNPLFFGKNLPSQLSGEALLFVLIATPLLSLLAGLIPAWKASRIPTSAALRSE